MKKSLFLLSAALLYAQNITITDLFDKIKQLPETKLDQIKIKETKVMKKSVVSSLYPQINLFMNAEHYNSPFSIKPLTPTESAQLIQMRQSIPFSQNILRIGFDFSMPLFIKSIYDTKEKINHLIEANKYKAKLNLLQREATLVTLLSNYEYLVSLKKALITQKNSINQTINAIKVGVEVGRIPEFKLLRLKDSLNQIDIKINEIDTKITETLSNIYTLTKTKLNAPVKFNAYKVEEKEFIQIKPIKESIKASTYDIKAKKDEYIPKIMLKANANRAMGWAYNTGERVFENTGVIGIYLNWSVFNKKNSSEIQKAKIEKISNTLTLQKTLKDLKAKVAQIDENLQIIKKSITLAKKSVALKKELLNSAKVAFKLNTMTVDEYLQYENDLANAKANLANLLALKKSLIAQKALIYGNNFKKVFK